MDVEFINICLYMTVGDSTEKERQANQFVNVLRPVVPPGDNGTN